MEGILLKCGCHFQSFVVLPKLMLWLRFVRSVAVPWTLWTTIQHCAELVRSASHFMSLFQVSSYWHYNLIQALSKVDWLSVIWNKMWSSSRDFGHPLGFSVDYYYSILHYIVSLVNLKHNSLNYKAGYFKVKSYFADNWRGRQIKENNFSM